MQMHDGACAGYRQKPNRNLPSMSVRTNVKYCTPGLQNKYTKLFQKTLIIETSTIVTKP